MAPADGSPSQSASFLVVVYLLRTQKKIPLRPRNHKQPMKRTRARMAVEIRRNLKKAAVRWVELD